MKTTTSAYITMFLCILFGSKTYALDLNFGKAIPPPPIKHVTEGYEAESIQLNLGLDGTLKSIEVQACPSCQIDRLIVDSNTEFHIRHKEVSSDALTKFNGRSGSITYLIGTNILKSIRFFNLEGEL